MNAEDPDIIISYLYLLKSFTWLNHQNQHLYSANLFDIDRFRSNRIESNLYFSEKQLQKQIAIWETFSKDNPKDRLVNPQPWMI